MGSEVCQLRLETFQWRKDISVPMTLPQWGVDSPRGLQGTCPSQTPRLVGSDLGNVPGPHLRTGLPLLSPILRADPQHVFHSPSTSLGLCTKHCLGWEPL